MGEGTSGHGEINGLEDPGLGRGDVQIGDELLDHIQCTGGRVIGIRVKAHIHLELDLVDTDLRIIREKSGASGCIDLNPNPPVRQDVLTAYGEIRPSVPCNASYADLLAIAPEHLDVRMSIVSFIVFCPIDRHLDSVDVRFPIAYIEIPPGRTIFQESIGILVHSYGRRG